MLIEPNQQENNSSNDSRISNNNDQSIVSKCEKCHRSTLTKSDSKYCEKCSSILDNSLPTKIDSNDSNDSNDNFEILTYDGFHFVMAAGVLSSFYYYIHNDLPIYLDILFIIIVIVIFLLGALLLITKNRKNSDSL